WKRRERHERELGVEHEQDDGDAQDHHDVGAGHGDEHEQHLHLFGIDAGPGHELADLRPVVVAEVKALQLVEEPAPQLRLGPERDLERGVAPVGREPTDEHRRDDDGDRPTHERAAVVRVDAAVDGPQREQRDRDLRDGPAERGEHSEDDRATALRRDLAHQPPATATLVVLGRGWVRAHCRPRAQRGTRGMRRPAIPMISRCISLTPPPNVPMVAPAYSTSRLPARTAPAEPFLSVPAAPTTSMSSRSDSMRSSVPNTFMADASAGLSSPCSWREATRQLN